ncbi:hypothetical protein [Enterobacter phage EspM4VN]|uniref:Uncharacterized protein n=1 Tax=Enterobacter phage EspM4VN TaxID=2137745 RepID=A0A2Z6C864_9CAUD|nr:hypothetical protein HYP11_gp033 [Enterobacter phage EspM4VN]BBD52213.1 hypothetical protein [Enterobacter phage EspM4VN]
MKKPRITGHQFRILYGMRNFEFGNKDIAKVARYFHPKSWINNKGKMVWTVHAEEGRPVKGSSWDTRTGASLLAKGLIEPAGSMVHDGSYVNWPNTEVTFYRLTELGKSYL